MEEAPKTGRRATLLVSWRPQPADPGAALALGEALARTSCDTPMVATKGGTQISRSGIPVSDTSASAEDPSPVNIQAEQQGAGAPSALEPPRFAEYDASCNKWRCRLCALAGGRNAYAKGISMDATLVPMRMRIHARSAVHKQAESRENQADSARNKESVKKPAISIAADAGNSGGPSSSKMARAASYIVGTGSQQREQKRRRLCGKPFTHDRRICSIGITASLPATAVPPAKEPSNHVTGLCEDWLTAVAAVTAPKVAANGAVADSKPSNRLAGLGGA